MEAEPLRGKDSIRPPSAVLVATATQLNTEMTQSELAGQTAVGVGTLTSTESPRTANRPRALASHCRLCDGQ
jgi:hypothetical protein